jgi:hypothetical protein
MPFLSIAIAFCRRLTALAAVIGSTSIVVAACGGAGHNDLLDGTPDAGSKADAANSDAAGDARIDAGEAGSSDPGIRCASNYCTVGTQSCCREGDTTPYTDTCVPVGQCQGDGGTRSLEIPCDDTADCAAEGHPNMVCCVEGDSSSNAAAVTCRPPAECVASQGRAPLCDPASPNPCSPATPKCLPSTQTLVGYSICQP